MIRMLPARRYLFCTDGKHFQHPDPAAVARVVMGAPQGAELVFNYRTERTQMWDAPGLRAKYGYTTRLPQDGQAGIAVRPLRQGGRAAVARVVAALDHRLKGD